MIFVSSTGELINIEKNKFLDDNKYLDQIIQLYN